MSTLTHKVTANGALDLLEDLLRKRYDALVKEKSELQTRIAAINAEISELAAVRADILRKRSA